MTTTRTTGKTTTTARVLETFRDLDPVTPRQISEATGIDRPAVHDSLRKLAETGDVFLMEIWTLTPARRAKNREAPTRAARAAAIIAEQDGRTMTGRRAKGVLAEEILAFMHRRPGTDLGPGEIARAIGAKSGAVYPALVRLQREGVLTRTTEKPVRYRLA